MVSRTVVRASIACPVRVARHSVEEEQQKPKPSPTPSFRLRDVTNAFEDTPDSDQDLDVSTQDALVLSV